MQFSLDMIRSEVARRLFKKGLRTQEKLNRFWDEYLRPSLIIDDLGVFTGVMIRREGDHSHRTAVRVDRPATPDVDEPPEAIEQADLQFFTSPAGFPISGPHTDQWTRKRATKWQPPSDRPRLGYHWVFTLEHDPADLSGFEAQVRWFVKNQPGEEALIEKVDQALRRFKDYRGYVTELVMVK